MLSDLLDNRDVRELRAAPNGGVVSAADARVLRRLDVLEEKYRDGTWNHVPSRLHLFTGQTRVILTSPHSGATIRNRWPKPADSGTGGMTELIASRTGSAALTVVGYQPDDPNWDLWSGPFKQRLRGVMRFHPFVIDMHAMRGDRPMDVDLGLGPCPDDATVGFVREWAARGRALGLNVTIDVPFNARKPGTETITRYAQRAGARAFQIETNVRLRFPETFGTPARKTVVYTEWLQALVRAADKLARDNPLPIERNR